MLRRRHLTAFVLLCTALACTPHEKPQTPARLLSLSPLEAIAREIDPGAIDDLGTSLEIGPTPNAALAQAREAVDVILTNSKQDRFDHTPEQGRAFLVALADTERLAAKNEATRARACSLLLEGYGLLSAVIVTAHVGEQMARLSGSRADLSPIAKKELAVLHRETELRRRAAACVLRATGPSPEELALALEAAGRHLANEGDFTRARDLHEQAMARRGDAATATDWLRLASVRATALAHVEARAALARARQLEPKLPAIERPSYLRTATHNEGRIQTAEKASRLFGAKDRESEIAYGLLLRDLRPAGTVRPLLAALEKRYPDDARPVVALARLRVEDDSLDPATLHDAEAIAGRAEALKNRTREYWDLLMAFAATDFMRAVAAPASSKEDVVARMKAVWSRVNVVARGLSEFDPGRAAALGLAEELLRIALDASGSAEESVRTLLVSKADTFGELGARYPASVDVARCMLLIAFAQVATETTDVPRAFRFAGRDVTEAAREEGALVTEQLRLFIGLGVRHPTYLPYVEAILARAAQVGPETPQSRALLSAIEADYLAARWRTDNTPELTTRIAALYTEAVDMIPAADRPRTLSNLAVARWANGARSGPGDLMQKALALDPKAEHAILNRAILAALEKDVGAEKALEAFGADESNRSEARATALAWVAKLARDRSDLPRARTAAKDALAATRGTVALERALLFEGSMNIGVEYAPSSPRLYRLPMTARMDLWLTFAPAMPDAELKALAAAVPKPKPPKK